MPAGAYQAAWVDTLTANVGKGERFQHPGGIYKRVSWAYAENIALHLKRSTK